MKQRPVTSVTSILRLALVIFLGFYPCGLSLGSDTKGESSVEPTTTFRLIIRDDMGMKQVPLTDNKFPIVSQTLGTVIAEFENGIKVEIQQDSTIQVFLKTRRLTAEHGQGRIIFRKSTMPLERVVYNNRLGVSQYRGIVPVGAYYSEGGKLSGFTKQPNEIVIQYALGEGRGQIIRTLRAVAFIVNGYPFDGFSETITLLRDENTIPLFDAQTGTVWDLGSTAGRSSYLAKCTLWAFRYIRVYYTVGIGTHLPQLLRITINRWPAIRFHYQRTYDARFLLLRRFSG